MRRQYNALVLLRQDHRHVPQRHVQGRQSHFLRPDSPEGEDG